MNRKTAGLLATAAVAALVAGGAPAATASDAPDAAGTPQQTGTQQTGTQQAGTQETGTKDPFYSYDGSKPLSEYKAGDVLKKRTVDYHIVGIKTPLKAVQILYRTVDAQKRPSANVTTVVRSPKGDGTKAISYQSFYDSLDPEHGPSRSIAGNLSFGGIVYEVENLLMAPLLSKGYDLVIPDTEGQTAEFAAGPAYGTNTLDSIRAVTREEAGTPMNKDTRWGLMGYSGGAIATNWAAAMAPEYAPDVNEKLVGFAEGGLLVAPAHNLKYTDGALVWNGVIPMALMGVSRAYDVDLTKYMSDYGKKTFDRLEKDGSIANALGQFPGLTWKKLAKPEYANPNSVADYINTVNKVNLGQAATPTVPGFIGQGNGGVLEGTFNNPPGIGTGDGVMVAGDVRGLANQYCKTGNSKIQYKQYNLLSHVTTVPLWIGQAIGYLEDRFEGKAAPSSCGSIPAGNSLAPEKLEPAAK